MNSKSEGAYHHWLFDPPCAKDDLHFADWTTAEWLTRNHHGLNWDSGVVPYAGVTDHFEHTLIREWTLSSSSGGAGIFNENATSSLKWRLIALNSESQEKLHSSSSQIHNLQTVLEELRSHLERLESEEKVKLDVLTLKIAKLQYLFKDFEEKFTQPIKEMKQKQETSNSFFNGLQSSVRVIGEKFLDLSSETEEKVNVALNRVGEVESAFEGLKVQFKELSVQQTNLSTIVHSIAQRIDQTDRYTKFEGLNNQISVNVFQISEEKQIYPVYLTFDEKIQHVNLLLLHDGEKSLYCYIRHLSRLISGQISSHGHVTFTCNTCFHCFPTRDKLQEHKSNCSEINDCPVISPNENEKTLKFKNHHKKEAIHSIVYADFECLLTQYNYEQVNDRFFELNNVYEDDKENIPPQESPNATFSDYGEYAKLKKSKIVGKAFQRHVPYSAGLYHHDRYEVGKSYYTSFRGRNCTTLFAPELKRIAEVVQRVSIRIGTRKS
ncbi:hypothetical protein QAD02_002095 [Eretmocerus hayati]|uniref:Uncharacterized protein n=1 Tax=Eretmocerus hayati TaxID=131215 RepID=A0ACC2NIB3_9HYME|nr:hypothetical protein QAD02_002095 [Eretmocerus hayati]